MICPYMKQHDYMYHVNKKGEMIIFKELEHFPECDRDCPYIYILPGGKDSGCHKIDHEISDWNIKDSYFKMERKTEE